MCSAWEQIRACLDRAKDRVYEQICGYPTPIAGCDQQFNALLERRTAVTREWEALDAAEAERLAADDAVVEAFIQQSQCLDATDKQSVVRHLRGC